MGRRVDEASAKNIANAASQHKIIVPFTSPQQRLRNGFGQLLPIANAIQQGRERVQWSVIIDVRGLELGA
jgi:hypothetical protein